MLLKDPGWTRLNTSAHVQLAAQEAQRKDLEDKAKKRVQARKASTGRVSVDNGSSRPGVLPTHTEASEQLKSLRLCKD
eukprot:scaffold72098_cov21-Tisochrysis_lutea.AAC.1